MAILGGVRAKTKKVRRIRGPRDEKLKLLIFLGFHSNLVHFTFSTIEIDIKTNLGVSDNFRALKGVSGFSAILYIREYFDRILSC